MGSEFVDIIMSLTAIMEEETARLLAPGRHRDLGEMAAAKIKLVAALEVEMTTQSPTPAQWVASLEEEAREILMSAIARLHVTAQENAKVLTRQIELSTEMMGAVAAEARRLSGMRSAIYGSSGMINRLELATPISINASL